MTVLEQALEGTKSVAILGHVRPDGDCLGSTLGLYNYLLASYPDILGCSPVRMRSWNRHTAKCPTAVKLRKVWQRVIVSAAMMQKTVRGIP